MRRVRLKQFEEPLTEEARHWYGFMLCLGLVSIDRRDTMISVPKEKVDLLSQLVKFLGSHGRPRPRHRLLVQEIRNEGLAERLLSLGFFAGSLMQNRIAPHYALDPCVWRGVFDAVGEYTQLRGAVKLVPGLRVILKSQLIAQQFQALALEKTGTCPKMRVHNHTFVTKKSRWRVGLCGRDALALDQYLDLHLTRTAIFDRRKLTDDSAAPIPPAERLEMPNGFSGLVPSQDHWL